MLAVRLGLSLAFVLLLGNLAARSLALHFAGSTWDDFASGVALALGLCLRWPSLLRPALTAFGASFLLYGFHSYRLQSQAFEFLVAAFAMVLLLRLASAPRSAPAAGRAVILPLFVLYVALAAFSLLLLPFTVLEHRLFVEGSGIFRAVLGAFPGDPLYPIAGVNRLALFLVFATLLGLQADARSLFRALFRGIAWASMLAVAIGLLDFMGGISLARQNLSRVLWGPHARRLQSTFQNPGWFACFVSLALPLVLLEWREAGRRHRAALMVFFPLCAASLFLSGARASWLAGLVLAATLLVLARVPRPRGDQPPAPSTRTAWLVLGSVIAGVAWLAVGARGPAPSPSAGAAAPARLEGLRQEILRRGLGLDSPRSVATAHALELARQGPILGLGYESYNLHLRAQLALPGSRVAAIVDAAAPRYLHETVFDDAHNTYLQVLTGTGSLGLALWLALGGAGVLVAALALRRESDPMTPCVLLVLIVFHFYGLFQGMAYIPVTWFSFSLATGYVMTLDTGPVSPGVRRATTALLWALSGLVLLAGLGYAAERGYRSLKRTFAVDAYLPDEAAEYEGFYRPESGPSGEFRWMARRGIINVTRAAPFRLAITCDHPDAAAEAVVVSLRFNGDDAGSIVFRRPGTVEKRLAPGAPGALRLTVSRTFRPAAGSADRRELGVAVGAVRWE